MNGRRAAVVLLVIALGLANAVALYGLDPLRPTNIGRAHAASSAGRLATSFEGLCRRLSAGYP